MTLVVSALPDVVRQTSSGTMVERISPSTTESICPCQAFTGRIARVELNAFAAQHHGRREIARGAGLVDVAEGGALEILKALRGIVLAHHQYARQIRYPGELGS